MTDRFAPVFLATDFSLQGPYVGLLRAAVMKVAPGLSVIDLIHDLPPFDPDAAGMLLAALLPFLPERAVIAAVVDPGVGGARPPVAVRAGGRWLVGPGNGLFDAVADDTAKAGDPAIVHEILWRPDHLSASFHGRDLFAPVAAMLASGEDMQKHLGPGRKAAAAAIAPAARRRIIYIDGYGNCMTGLREADMQGYGCLSFGNGRVLERAGTFCAVPLGTAFWYVNSLGLAEIAVNGGSAASLLGLSRGDEMMPRACAE